MLRISASRSLIKQISISKPLARNFWFDSSLWKAAPKGFGKFFPNSDSDSNSSSKTNANKSKSEEKSGGSGSSGGGNKKKSPDNNNETAVNLIRAALGLSIVLYLYTDATKTEK